jgi:hypothetical protein
LSACHDCSRPYGDEHGFPDLLIPDAEWRKISPNGDGPGLLCPSCICKRLYDAGITDCPGAFMSGPIRTVAPELFEALSWIERQRERGELRRARMADLEADAFGDREL